MPIEITRDAFYSIAEVSQIFGFTEKELFDAAKVDTGGLKVANIMGTHYVRGDHLYEYLEAFLLTPEADPKKTGRAPALPTTSSHSQISGILRTGEYEDPLSSDPGVPATERQVETPSDPDNPGPPESDLKLYDPQDQNGEGVPTTAKAEDLAASRKTTERDAVGISSSTGRMLIPPSESSDSIEQPGPLDPPSSGRYNPDDLMEEMERYQRESESGGIETSSGKTGQRSEIDDTWL